MGQLCILSPSNNYLQPQEAVSAVQWQMQHMTDTNAQLWLALVLVACGLRSR